jgi:hypothetical protein
MNILENMICYIDTPLRGDYRGERPCMNAGAMAGLLMRLRDRGLIGTPRFRRTIRPKPSK